MTAPPEGLDFAILRHGRHHDYATLFSPERLGYTCPAS